MTKDAYECFSAAAESDSTPEEVWNRVKERSERVDWDLENILPELFEQEQKRSQLDDFVEEETTQ